MFKFLAGVVFGCGLTFFIAAFCTAMVDAGFRVGNLLKRPGDVFAECADPTLWDWEDEESDDAWEDEEDEQL